MPESIDGLKSELEKLRARLGEAEKVVAALPAIAWQFNEAVSMLRETFPHVVGFSIGVDIEEGLPEIQSALERLAALAAYDKARSDG